ncbi:DUF3320 domain-containing protein [Paenibacillus dendritiformis]|uniref:DUF3320 domain-containing protein n=1 Tax=Paenibacillus dendritiformis TaxID=130049 RepID=UPI00248C7A54|nr:DUF3320 domain-containing protein [Paenibacillus dendritiformis]WGU95125.1 DUF3320 domain-containing protein [Paenibacillus dendritiformis]
MTTLMQTKLEHARQELLDLGMRNPLLNYRLWKARGLEISGENPAEVLRVLVQEKKRVRFAAARPETGRPVAGEGAALCEAGPSGADCGSAADAPASVSLPTVAVTGKLRTLYPEAELHSRLLNTYYAARTYVEEQGVNVLYAALGMLHWYEAGNRKEMRKAPLLLVPVQLERLHAGEPFAMTYTDAELGFNLSLAAKLKKDYGLALPQPEDEDCPDVDAYYAAVEAAIADQEGWTVDRNAVVIGLFSFGKFLMYHDLDLSRWPEHADPSRHPVLNALLGEGFREPPSGLEEEGDIDASFHPVDNYLIMDADSSQWSAIHDAIQGRDLVIQGPPGTGKSQTIANLIAESVGAGLKVLFVAEKLAALDVVKRRLDAAGLGAACLEVHSHKTSKRSLLDELTRTWEAGRPGAPDEGGIRLVSELRDRLNAYCRAVNTPVGASGVTPYAAAGELLRFRSGSRPGEFPEVRPAGIADWTDAESVRREAALDELQAWLVRRGLPSAHPFWGCRTAAFLPADADSLARELRQAAQAVQAAADTVRLHAAAASYPEPDGLPGARAFGEACRRIAEAPPLEGIEVRSHRWLQKKESLLRLAESGLAYVRLRAEFDAVVLPEAWSRDVLADREAVAAYGDKWWRFLSSAYRRARRRTLGMCRSPKEDVVPPLAVLDAILQAKRLKAVIDGQAELAQALFPSWWHGTDSDWDRLGQAIPWIIAFHEDRVKGLLPEAALDLLPGGMEEAGAARLEQAARETEACTAEADEAIERLSVRLGFDAPLRFGAEGSLSAQPFAALMALFASWTGREAEAQDMAAYNRLSSACRDIGLAEFVELASAWTEAPDRLADCYRWNRYEAILSRAYRERPALAQFDGALHEDAVRKFGQWDRYVTLVNRYRLADLHWRSLPRHEAGGQLGVLLREFEKKTRHLPVRQLFARAGRAIQAMKPVFMMGPLSVAAYLEPGAIEFDLVIFDEASQVKPVDALGAIIRAKQAVVVGDSKQLPPTRFFDTMEEPEADEDDGFVAEAESVLSLFVGQQAPQRMLRWHYRSRHESLIAVSNREFYGDRLVVFPSPDADKRGSGLIWRHVPESVYDRGRSRTNRKEAAAVAAAVLEHARRYPHLTLGVAAFSMAQMRAIADEVERRRQAHPDGEPFFAAHPHEPFFVKNLENVQGDERDVIFISIGYGRQADGSLAMDFGPLNREGGERRLNVLISRARLRCEVFTNLRAEDIDLSRTQARGVQALRTFLHYAETGGFDGRPAADVGPAPGPALLEELVRDRLLAAGYAVDRQVGTAGSRIDLAVRALDAEAGSRYVLGIEFDGPSYARVRSARDRDRLRRQVLEGLGWRIHRVWSMEWFRHPEREWKRLLDAVQQAVDESRHAPGDEAGTGRGTGEPASGFAAAADSGSAEDPNPAAGGSPSDARPTADTAAPALLAPALLAPALPASALPAPAWVPPPPAGMKLLEPDSEPDGSGDMREQRAVPYTVAVLHADRGGKPFHALPVETVADWLLRVIEAESPIPEEEAVKRVYEAAGMKRMGSRMQESFAQALEELERQGHIRRRGVFLWSAAMTAPPVRSRAQQPGMRRLEAIAPEERQEAIRLAIRQAYGLDKELVPAAALQLLGWSRTTDELKRAIQEQVEDMIRAGEIAERGTELVLPG